MQMRKTILMSKMISIDSDITQFHCYLSSWFTCFWYDDISKSFKMKQANPKVSNNPSPNYKNVLFHLQLLSKSVPTMKNARHWLTQCSYIIIVFISNHNTLRVNIEKFQNCWPWKAINIFTSLSHTNRPDIIFIRPRVSRAFFIFTTLAPPQVFPNRCHRMSLRTTRRPAFIRGMSINTPVLWRWPTFNIKIRSPNIQRILSTPVHRWCRRRRICCAVRKIWLRINCTSMGGTTITHICMIPNLSIICPQTALVLASRNRVNHMLTLTWTMFTYRYNRQLRRRRHASTSTWTDGHSMITENTLCL